MAGMLLLGFSLAAVPASKKNEEALRQLAGSADTMLKKSDEPSGADSLIHKLEFKEAKMVDVIRALADMSGLNIVATKDAGAKEVTVFLQKITVKDALDTISKNSGLWYRQDKNSNTYRIMTTEEFQKDMVVYREDTTRIFNLLHPNPVVVATAIRDVYGDRVHLTLGVEDSATGLGSNGGAGGAAGAGIVSSGISNRNGSLNGVRQATTRQTSTVTNGTTGRSGGAAGTESERVLKEKLTSDQLERLGALLPDGAAGVISSDALNQFSRNEQPIYITVNREHNLIIVRTTDAGSMKDIERLIRDMDRPTPQVLLEMKVLELAAGESFRQSFSLSATFDDGKHSIGLGNFPSEGGTLVYQFMNNVITARLEMLEKNNKVTTLSSPILLASNNKPAQVFVGEERVLVVGVSASATTVDNGVVIPTTIVPVTEVRNIGNTLQILPKINADRSVTLNIVQDASTVNVGGATLPVFVGGNGVQTFNIDTVNTSNIQGTVVAKDGLTVAIGGLIQTSTSKNTQKVPFFGDIPMVGKLFRREEDSNSKSELILLITPRIITNPSEAEDVSNGMVETLSVQEW